MAHEIRNPLNYISLAIDHLRSEVVEQCPERAGEVTALADKIREEVRRANYMVINFMNYGRPLKLRKSEITYSELLERTLSVLYERLAAQQVTIEQRISPDLPVLLLDPELMRNCITNFINNAAQAMPMAARLCWRGNSMMSPAGCGSASRIRVAALLLKIRKRSSSPTLPPRTWGSAWGLPLPNGLSRPTVVKYWWPAVPVKGQHFRYGCRWRS